MADMKLSLPRWLLMVVAWSGASALTGGADAPARVRPNVLFLLIDDMGYADLSCYGNRAVHTANIAAHAARRLVTSASSMVTIERFTWMAVPIVSRMESIVVSIRVRWSSTSRK